MPNYSTHNSIEVHLKAKMKMILFGHKVQARNKYQRKIDKSRGRLCKD
jgi:hypothetical protein